MIRNGKYLISPKSNDISQYIITPENIDEKNIQGEEVLFLDLKPVGKYSVLFYYDHKILHGGRLFNYSKTKSFINDIYKNKNKEKELRCAITLDDYMKYYHINLEENSMMWSMEIWPLHSWDENKKLPNFGEFKKENIDFKWLYKNFHKYIASKVSLSRITHIPNLEYGGRILEPSTLLRDSKYRNPYKFIRSIIDPVTKKEIQEEELYEKA